MIYFNNSIKNEEGGIIKMKGIIIVCEDKLRKYGDFLAQLVSLEDDTDESIIGVKDGEVNAVVWSESEYKSNTSQLSSNQHILFIGNSKMIKEKREHMLKKFCEHGIDYRWLGKQAALFVEKGMDVEDRLYEFVDCIDHRYRKVEK